MRWYCFIISITLPSKELGNAMLLLSSAIYLKCPVKPTLCHYKVCLRLPKDNTLQLPQFWKHSNYTELISHFSSNCSTFCICEYSQLCFPRGKLPPMPMYCTTFPTQHAQIHRPPKVGAYNYTWNDVFSVLHNCF